MRLSRRSLLAGGAGVVGIGAAAAVGVETEVLPGRSWAYRHLGLDGGAGKVPDVRGGRVVSGSFRSAHRPGVDIGYAVAYPPGVPSDAKLPFVLALHGRHEDHAYAMSHDHLGLDLFLADAVAHGVPPFAIASVDGGDTYWHRRSSGEDAGAAALDLVKLLRRRGLTDRFGFLGWSMGGFGALHLTLQLGASAVRGVGVMSPALWHEYADSAPGAFDDAADFAAMTPFGHQAALSGTRLRIDCGESDPFYGATKDFRAGFETAPGGGFELGGHTGDYWRRMAPAQLRMLGNALA